MKNEPDQDTEPMRMLFEMTRDDNPRLYDDLVRFNKGTKRVNRLRFLAHEGLLAQNWMLVPAGGATVPSAASLAHGPVNVNAMSARQVVQAFDAPSSDDDD